MPLDPQRFRQTMGSLVTGVTVVAARDARGVLRGMTAASVTSLSLEPPMLLVCVGHDAEIHDTLVGSPLFTVSVLAEGQDRLAERFATRGSQHFDDLDARVTPGGLPVIAGAIAHLECRRDAVHAAGDHTIVTGVIEWAATEPGAPLCHFRSRYMGVVR
ncbi:MAG: flavin reductase family protein [Gemmatimonadales bacterium]|nr:flavin reductase family protein [Gemmatimonadales bacterium]